MSKVMGLLGFEPGSPGSVSPMRPVVSQLCLCAPGDNCVL